jgi:hypothetical protein
MKQAVLALLISYCQLSLCVAPGDGWFYSSHGWYNNTCKVAQCETNCNIGLYRLGCSGNTTGDCVVCTNGPPFSSYTHRGNLISDCSWSCNLGYSQVGQACILNANCTNQIPGGSEYSNTNYPNCDHQCRAGYFGSPLTNPTKCDPCQAGTYSLKGDEFCTTCAAGTYSAILASPSAVNCQKCLPGTYSASTGAILASTCLSCPGGTYSIASGAIVCQDCPTGTSSAMTGANSAAVCSLCTAGKYTGVTGRIACTSCDAGTFALTGATKCLDCTPDTFADTTGMGACVPCAICNTPGIYRAGCGPVSAGSCTTCSNPF